MSASCWAVFVGRPSASTRTVLSSASVLEARTTTPGLPSVSPFPQVTPLQDGGGANLASMFLLHQPNRDRPLGCVSLCFLDISCGGSSNVIDTTWFLVEMFRSNKVIGNWSQSCNFRLDRNQMLHRDQILVLLSI